MNNSTETAVLSILANNPDQILELPEINTLYFTSDSTKTLYNFIFDSYQKRGTTSVDFILAELSAKGRLTEVGGQAFVSQIFSNTHSKEVLPHYYELLRDSYTERSFKEALASARNSVEVAVDLPTVISTLRNYLDKISGTLLPNMVSTKESVDEYFVDLDERRIDRDSKIIDSGWDALNLMLMPEGGTLIGVAGRPGVGKSTVMLNMAMKSRAKGRFYSLEMPRLQINRKVFSMVALIDSKLMKLGRIEDSEYDKLVDVKDIVKARYENLEIITFFGGIESLFADIRKSAIIDGVRVFYIDYLQLLVTKLKDRNKSTNDLVGYITSTLKQLAIELNVVIYLGAQLNRGAKDRSNKRPVLMDFRDSGNIEQDIDTAILLYSENPDEKKDDNIPDDVNITDADVLEIIIAKNRDGNIGKLLATYKKQFSDIYFVKGERPWTKPLSPTS